MIFPQNITKAISISSQPSKFSYSVDISSLNQTGTLTLGFSGQSGNHFNFILKSGKIFDYNNHFVSTFSNSSTVKIQGNVENNKQSYYINNTPIKFNQQLNTGAGQIDSFYVIPSNVSPDISFSILGEKPSYLTSLINFGEFNTTGTGYLINTDSSRYFRLHSGVSNNSDYTWVSGFTGVINTGQSGVYLVKKNYSPTDATDFSESAFQVDLSLYTNFGEIQNNISGQNNFQTAQSLSLDFQSLISGSGTNNNFLSWSNTKGSQVYDAAAVPISFSLSRTAGTGNFTGIWKLYTGAISYPLTYSEVLYNIPTLSYSGNFDAVGASGLAIAIERLNESGNSQTLFFNSVGLNTSASIVVSGIV